MTQSTQKLGAALSLALGLLLGIGMAACLSRYTARPGRQVLTSKPKTTKTTDDDAPLFI